jgi:hypothetical protein
VGLALLGIEGQDWFLNFHCFTKYVKVAFFRGTSLRPLPRGESKHKARNQAAGVYAKDRELPDPASGSDAHLEAASAQVVQLCSCSWPGEPGCARE